MIATWFRRALVVLACASGALLTACGSSTVDSALVPSRFLAVGDGFSDLGQTSNATVTNARYTVNDGSAANWTEQLAGRFGHPLKASNLGGLSYAHAHARIDSATDGIGGTAPSIRAQIDALLAANTFGVDDVVLVQGGVSEILYYVEEYRAGRMSEEQMLWAVDAAGRAFGGQIRRLVDAGAKHVVVVGAYGMHRSPYAISNGLTGILEKLSYAGETGDNRPRSFNWAMESTIADLGAYVLYVDAAYYFNLLTGTPATHGFDDQQGALPVMVCNSVDATAGNGTGFNQVNSALCTTSTLVAGVDYARRLFADGLYFTPNPQRMFGNYAYDALRRRW